MLTTTDLAKLYDTVLSIPGMNDIIKMDLKISRKNVLLLNNAIRCGLNVKDDDKSNKLIESLPEETIKEISALAEVLITKAGLTELSEKLSAFHAAK